MVNQFGECVDMRQDGYNSGMNYRIAQQKNLTESTVPTNETEITVPQAWHFPALDAKYCTRNDTTRLDLAGWRVQQLELVEKENLRLAGAEDGDVIVELQLVGNEDAADASDTGYTSVTDSDGIA
ncbi:hypothetical protein ATCC90586_011994 [Pythium insidiosum]|nr:hypothetical protein ATCC90586_011994 [Pythium insidiosum]